MFGEVYFSVSVNFEGADLIFIENGTSFFTYRLVYRFQSFVGLRVNIVRSPIRRFFRSGIEVDCKLYII